MIYSVNDGASIKVQLGLSIVEIYVDQHSESQKDSYFIVSKGLCSDYLTIENIFWDAFRSDSLCPRFLLVIVFYVALDLI